MRFEGRSSYNVDYIPHPLEVVQSKLSQAAKSKRLQFVSNSDCCCLKPSEARDSAKPPKNVWEPGRPGVTT